MGQRFVVHGAVQGVGFRWFVARHAERLGLAGWVRNRSDGTVEVVATGDARGLSELARALGRGPQGARVERVEEVEMPGEVEDYKAFEIK